MDSEFEIIFDGILGSDDIEIFLLPDCKKYTARVEKLINEAWQKGIEADHHLYDGEVYSLLDYFSGNKLGLQVIKTSYKAYYGTNIVNYSNISDKSELANILACCCVCETSDNKIILGQRSNYVAEDKNFWHVAGGNIEGELDPYNTIRNEIEEEFNISTDDIDYLTCIGFARNLKNYKPEFLFYAKLNKTAKEIDAKIANASEVHEHSYIKYFDSNELDCILIGCEIVAIGKAALTQYDKVIKNNA